MADRISELPDDVLKHILSLLSTREAAATMVLSHEWVRISTLLPSLEYSFISTIDEDDVHRMNSFINGVLYRSNAPEALQKLVLRCTQNENPRPIEQMIHVAIDERNVKHLVVSVSYDEMNDYFTLPEIVFRSIHLEHLGLSGVIVNVPPQGPQQPVFPSLRTLQVDISLHCPPCIQNFYSRCPILQELSMVGHVDDHPDENDMRKFHIYSGTIRKLQISVRASIEMVDMDDDGYRLYRFNIYAPKVQLLIINENILAAYRVRNLSSIVEARLQVGWQAIQYQRPEVDVHEVNDIFNLLKGLTGVRSLELHHRTTGAAGFIFHEKYLVELNQTEDQEHEEHEVFEAEQQVWALFRTEVPLFRRLTRLYVGLSHSYGWNFLVYLLDRTPALEMLIIEMVIMENFPPEDRFAWKPPQSRPNCLTQAIQRVHLRGCVGHEEEWLPVIEYFQDISHTIHHFEIIIDN